MLEAKNFKSNKELRIDLAGSFKTILDRLQKDNLIPAGLFVIIPTNDGNMYTETMINSSQVLEVIGAMEIQKHTLMANTPHSDIPYPTKDLPHG